jgi:hypothetical protein
MIANPLLINQDFCLKISSFGAINYARKIINLVVRNSVMNRENISQ